MPWGHLVTVSSALVTVSSALVTDSSALVTDSSALVTDSSALGLGGSGHVPNRSRCSAPHAPTARPHRPESQSESQSESPAQIQSPSLAFIFDIFAI